MERKRCRPADLAFDLTPMIDVTFQLIIFFILTMRIHQKERREAADLPHEDGPLVNDDVTPRDFLVLRMFWRHDEMRYEVNCKFGNNEGRMPDAVPGGSLTGLMRDRADQRHTEYRRIFEQLLAALRVQHRRVPGATKIELVMSLDSTRSSRDQIGDTAPFGFVTLALDVCTAYSQECSQSGLGPMGVTFKNTEPGGVPRIAGKQ